MTSRKIDGYVAWHPDEGFIPLTYKLTHDEAEVQLFNKIAMAYLNHDQYESARQEDFRGHLYRLAIELAAKDGWQIKPVCLISPERLEELEENERASNGLLEACKMGLTLTIGEHEDNDE